jgi:hypothetical protein
MAERPANVRREDARFALDVEVRAAPAEFSWADDEKYEVFNYS